MTKIKKKKNIANNIFLYLAIPIIICILLFIFIIDKNDPYYNLLLQITSCLIALLILYVIFALPIIIIIREEYHFSDYVLICIAISVTIVTIICIEDEHIKRLIIKFIYNNDKLSTKDFLSPAYVIEKILYFIKKATELVAIASLVNFLNSYYTKKIESKNEQSNDLSSENNQPITEKSKSQNIKKESEFLNTSIGLVVIAFLISLITYKSEQSSEEKESPHD